MPRDKGKWCPTCERTVPSNRWWDMTGLCTGCSHEIMRRIKLCADRLTYRQGRRVQ